MFCDKCIYFLLKGEGYEDWKEGICRRYPPTVIPTQHGTHETVWPEVSSYTICGEFVESEEYRKPFKDIRDVKI